VGSERRGRCPPRTRRLPIGAPARLVEDRVAGCQRCQRRGRPRGRTCRPSTPTRARVLRLPRRRPSPVQNATPRPGTHSEPRVDDRQTPASATGPGRLQRRPEPALESAQLCSQECPRTRSPPKDRRVTCHPSGQGRTERRPEVVPPKTLTRHRSGPRPLQNSCDGGRSGRVPDQGRRGPDEAAFVVLTDTEGNLFCVVNVGKRSHSGR
jgi:hypothetical protein